jgi:hypothetical protein
MIWPCGLNTVVMAIDVEILADELREDLDKCTMCPYAIMSRFRFITETSRRAGAYSDPMYVPFYYYLGKKIQPRKLLKFGFNLGLLSGAFLTSCRSVEDFYAFHLASDRYYAARIGIKNVRTLYANKMRYHYGSASDFETIQAITEGWDLIILNQECGCDDFRSYLDLLWDGLAIDGLLVVEDLSHHDFSDAYKDFCLSKNRKEIVVETRYSTGLIQK